MSTVREHLSTYHKVAADHHEVLAGHFGHLAKCLKKADFAADKTVEPDESAHAHLQAIADEHAAAAQFHKEACEACMKAASADLEKANQLEPFPRGLATVTPTVPHLRAVPRAGAAPLGTPVAEHLKSVIGSTEDDEERSLG